MNVRKGYIHKNKKYFNLKKSYILLNSQKRTEARPSLFIPQLLWHLTIPTKYTSIIIFLDLCNNDVC